MYKCVDTVKVSCNLISSSLCGEERGQGAGSIFVTLAGWFDVLVGVNFRFLANSGEDGLLLGIRIFSDFEPALEESIFTWTIK